ncbi:MAG: HD domain-containing protein [Bacteroidaceae bacterium]|nr:HD domain-containing protein [Bacteroidaceae bacterium]
MQPLELLKKYTSGNEALYEILQSHSKAVADRALSIVKRHPEWQVDKAFIYEAALLHDIGCVRVNAPAIHCLGDEPYVRHGLLGGVILRAEGLPLHARVAERHTGTGLTAEEIIRQALPLPPQDLTPETLEEQIICYADKFCSKTRLGEEKTYEQAARSLQKFGEKGLLVFAEWHKKFEC